MWTTIIVDNSPLSYMFHPQNAIGCSTFIDDVENDRELHSIGRFLLSVLKVRAGSVQRVRALHAL